MYKNRRKELTTVFLDPGVLEEVKEIAKRYKHHNRSDVIRYAISWAISKDKFLDVLKEIDND